MVQPIIPQNQIGSKRDGSNKGGKPQKYVLDDAGRRLIRDLYDGSSDRVTELAERLHAPRWRICKWASELSPVVKKDRPWFPEEEEYLKKHLHKKNISTLAEELGRTKASIRAKARKLNLNGKEKDGYNMAELAEILGYDTKVIQRWVKLGWLKGKREHVLGDVMPGPWIFTDKAIRDFIRLHPNEIDPRRSDWLSLAEIMLGGLGNLSPQID